MQKSKIKKDKVFVFVVAIVVANLSYRLILNIWNAIELRLYACAWCWALIIAHIIAIIGTLWLLQNYRRGVRIEIQTKESKETKEE